MLSTDVLVIGGGPAGLAAAIAARRKGLEVMVVDGARPPIDKACGEGLMPDGLAALNRLGIAPDPALGYRFRGIRFLDSGVSVEADFPEGTGLGVRRTVLHDAMVRAARAAGVSLRWETPVTSLDDTTGARWVVGADGLHSRVRKWATLDRKRVMHLRCGFRIHYRVAPWTDYMELYWGRHCQIYVTPVGCNEVCVAVISGRARLRLQDALPQFPELARRLGSGTAVGSERGAITTTCKVQRVERGRVALVGDASGSVDAITGEGLCLAFRQALALAESLASGSLEPYQTAHRRLSRRAVRMSQALLAMDSRAWLRHSALRLMAAQPAIFQRLLALHVGARSPIYLTGAPACVPEL